MSEYELMPFDIRNADALQEIYRLSFGSGVDPSYFRWKYLDNPAGHATTFVVRHKGDIVAFYGVIPEHYVINGEQRIIHQAMDGMTHPDHRGKGLFLQLSRASARDLEERNGMLHLIGYPGPTSFPAFVNRLEWRCLAEMKYRFIHPLAFRTAALFGGLAGATVARVTQLGPEWDAYFDGRDHRPNKIAKLLDRKVLQWRIWDHPTIHYEQVAVFVRDVPHGICIFRREASGRVFIVFLDVKHQVDTRTVLITLMHYLFGLQGVTGVYTFLSGDPHLERCLTRLGALTNPFKRGPYSYRTPFIVMAGPKSVEYGAYDWENYWIQPITRDY